MLSFRRPPATLPAVLAGLALPVAATAQTAPPFDARTWAPSMSPEAGLVLEPTPSPGSWQWNVAAWLSYAQGAVVLREPSGTIEPLAHQLETDLVAGVGLGDRAALGVDVPVLVFENGATGLPSGVVSGGHVPVAGLGDVVVLTKGTILRNDLRGAPAGFGLAAIGALSLPTGNRASFASDGSVTVTIRALAEYALGPAALSASLGYELRTAQVTWSDATLAAVTFGDQIPWSFGATLHPKGLLPSLDSAGRQSWEVALHGWVPAAPVAPFRPGAGPLSPALVTADDRVTLGHYGDAFVLAGTEVGLDRAIGVPAVRFVAAVGWAPRAHDRDHDGIPDDVDECPDLPEDRDGIQDQDGCPEDDADDDGILDPQDACPLVPGVGSNDPKKNGCPAPDTDGDGAPKP